MHCEFCLSYIEFICLQKSLFIAACHGMPQQDVHPAHPELLYRYVYAVYHVYMLSFVGFCFNILRPGQNDPLFPDDIFKCILLKENKLIFD